MNTQKPLWKTGATALTAMSLVLAPAVLAPSMATAQEASVLNSVRPMAEPGTAVLQNSFNFVGDQSGIDFFADKMAENEGIITYTLNCDGEEYQQDVWSDPEFVKSGNFNTDVEVDPALIGQTCEITGNNWAQWFETEDYDVITTVEEGNTVEVTDGGDIPLNWTVAINPLAPLAVNPDNAEARQGQTTRIDVLQNDSVKSEATLALSQYDEETQTYTSHETLETEQGTFTAVNAENGERYIEFTPAEGATGEVPTVDYWVNDARAEAMVETDPEAPSYANDVRALQTSSLDVTIVEANAPESAPDNIAAAYETPVTFNPTENDVLNEEGTTWESVALINFEGNEADSVTIEGGTFESNGDLTVTFTPEEGYSGTLLPLDYVATDSEGNKTYNVINVTVAEPAPAEAVADTAEGTQGEPITVKPLDNDKLSQTGTEWTDLSLHDEDGNRVKELTTDEGEYVVNDDLSVTFTSTDDFTGETESVLYVAEDDADSTTYSEITFTVNPADDDGDDGNDDDDVVEDALTIDPEQISAEDFVDKDKGVTITARGFEAGTEANLTVTPDTDNVRPFERSGTVGEDGTISFERIYGVSSDAETYVGNYAVEVSGEGQDDLEGSFTVGNPDDGNNGGEDNGNNEDGNNSDSGDDNGNDSGDDNGNGDDEGIDGARSETGGEMGASGKLGVLGGFAALSGLVGWALTRFGRKQAQ